MPIATDVKPDSSTDKGGSQSPPDGGTRQQETAEQKLARYESENKRKQEEIVSLRAERDEVKERLGRLETIEQRRDLTAREEAEKRKLSRTEDSLDDEINQMKAKPENSTFFKWIERENRKAIEEGESRGVIKTLTELGADFVEEMAEVEGLESADALFKKIKSEMPESSKYNPFMRVKKAYKAWKDKQAFLKDKDEVLKKKAELEQSREGAGRMSRTDNLDDAIKAGDRGRQRELLGIQNRKK